MSAEISLLLTVATSLGLSAILVFVLSKPLRRVLDGMCASGESSQFWVAFTSVMLFIAPLLLSVVSLSSRDGQPVVGVLRNTLIATLFGAFIGLLVIGLRISMASPRTRAH